VLKLAVLSKKFAHYVAGEYVSHSNKILVVYFTPCYVTL